MRYFCTYFDRNYLPRALALVRSLEAHCPAFRLWALCMDDACYAALCALDLPHLTPISLEAFEKGDDALTAAKQNRSRIEYYFTCTPSLPLTILDRWPEVDLITYLDADLYFFADPTPVYEEMGDRSVSIIAHRFPPRHRYREQFGIYNVGWLSFRRDERALTCLRWWRERCIEWCYDKVEPTRFADQKYLDDWPTRFEGVAVLEHKGANLAPWNVANYTLSRHENQLWVDDQPLIFFHFHGLKQVSARRYDPNLANYNTRIPPALAAHVITPYIGALAEATRALQPHLSGVSAAGGIRVKRPPLARRAISGVLKQVRFCKGLLTGRYVTVLGDRS